MIGNLWALPVVLLTFLAGFSSLPAHSQQTVRELNIEGIRFYRAKDYEKALVVLRKAAEVAEPQSMDELAVYENMLLVCDAKHQTDEELWQVKRTLWVLRHKLRGQAIPPEYDAETFQEGKDKLAAYQAEQKTKREYEKVLLVQEQKKRLAKLTDPKELEKVRKVKEIADFVESDRRERLKEKYSGDQRYLSWGLYSDAFVNIVSPGKFIVYLKYYVTTRNSSGGICNSKELYMATYTLSETSDGQFSIDESSSQFLKNL